MLIEYYSQSRMNSDSNITCRVNTEWKIQEKVSSVNDIVSKFVNENGK